MKSAGADYSKLKVVDLGLADALSLLSQKQIDLVWVFYGWEGIQAQLLSIPLNIVMMKDYFNVIPDYYTPVVIANESTISKKPETVKAFLKALSRGYDFAAKSPAEAAQVLLSQVPELDATLVKTSQNWLSPYYKADASRWGEQKQSVWQGYIDWMVQNKILKAPITASDAFTNEFLP